VITLVIALVIVVVVVVVVGDGWSTGAASVIPTTSRSLKAV